jgi:hypothetical protein
MNGFKKVSAPLQIESVPLFPGFLKPDVLFFTRRINKRDPADLLTTVHSPKNTKTSLMRVPVPETTGHISIIFHYSEYQQKREYEIFLFDSNQKL